MEEVHFQITGDGPALSAVFTRPKGGPGPLVVLSHGYLATKDSSKYTLMAQSLAGAGIASLRFDFRGCGDSGGEFADSVPSARLLDLKRVIRKGLKMEGVRGPLGLMGSSLGGYLSFLAGAEDGRIQTVALWSCPSDLRLMARRAGDRASERLREDIRGLPSAKDAGPGPSGLVIHGELDELVPVSHGVSVYTALTNPKRLVILGQAEHRFKEPEVRLKAVSATVDWFTGLLGRH